jgi:hypothetical protein
MKDLGAVIKYLTKEKDRLEKAITALGGVMGIISGKASRNGRGRRKLSAAAREKIAAAQRRRWAKVRAKAAKKAA